MYDFPAALYVKGDLPKEDEPAAAIIGARGVRLMAGRRQSIWRKSWQRQA